MKHISSVMFSLAVFILGLISFSDMASCLTASALSSGVNWSLYLNNDSSTPLQTGTVESGGEFVLDTDDISVSGSADLIAALDGIKFAFEGMALDDLDIRLILNTQGNSFNPVQGKACSFNMRVRILDSEGYDLQSESISITMTIPNGTGLNYLLGLSGNLHYNDLSFASFIDGSIKPERVSTSIFTQNAVVVFEAPATIVGGDSSNLGIPASVEYSTWYKVKKLFE